MTTAARLEGGAPAQLVLGGRSVVARVRRRMPWLGTIGPVLTLADAAAVVVAGLVATDDRPATLGLAALVAVLVARAADLHRPRLVLSIVEDLSGLFVAAAAATAVLVGAGSAGVAFCVLALACLVLAHTMVYAGTHVLRRGERLRRRVLVVGTGATARRLAQTLLTRPELGLRPVGFVGTGTASALDQARGLPLPLLGPVTGLPRSMTETHVDAVVVALAGPAGAEETAAVEGLLATRAHVYAVPAWFPPVRARARHPRELVDGIPVVHLHRRGTWLPVRAFKRLVEVLVALVTLLALLPVFAVLALLVRIETGGVLVRQPRIDERGRAVTVPRFRTRQARSVARPGTTFSVAISGRIGPVGQLMRHTRLAALPELVWALLRRVRYAGGVPVGLGRVLAPPPRADQPQVDAGQLTR
jgi:Bacterial sugar transferase/CoA-binding domain